MGQSELVRGELGNGGRPAGRGLGCLKLLLSEKSDWDSAAAPSKGERAEMSDMLIGTTRIGLVRPGGGEGESLVGNFKMRQTKKQTRMSDCCRSELNPVFIKMNQVVSPVVKSLRSPNQVTLKFYHLDCKQHTQG